MDKNSGNFKLSKNSFKFIRKAQWKNLEAFKLCKCLLKLEKCKLNDKSMKIFVKCTFP